MTASRSYRCDLRRSRLIETKDGIGLSFSTLDEQVHDSPDLQCHVRALMSFPPSLPSVPHS